MPRGNPKAKEAMKLTHEKRITLKEAWAYVKDGKKYTEMCACPGQDPPKRGEGYEKVATKYAKYMKTKKE